MSEPIDISGIDKAELLAELVNNCNVSMGRRGDWPPMAGAIMAMVPKMTIDEALKVVAEVRAWHASCRHPSNTLRFDYVEGRPIKCDIGGDTLDPRLYDRDSGHGAAASVVALIRERHRCKFVWNGALFECQLDAGHDGDHSTLNPRSVAARARAQSCGRCGGVGANYRDGLCSTCWHARPTRGTL